jgi:predicted RNase H-like HicB family nuclease
MRYAVVIEKGANGFGAYALDVPGCVAAAQTREEVVKLIQDAIEFHIEGLTEGGEPVPEPTSSVEFVD